MDSTGFDSVFEKVGEVQLPEYTGVRIMMLPVIIGDVNSVPDFIEGYKKTFRAMCEMAAIKHTGKVGYLTVDEKFVDSGKTHRRLGAHVDGMFNGSCGAWGGGGTGGGWGSHGNGMLTVSNPAGCIAYQGRFTGFPGPDGECYHLMGQAKEGKLFEENILYWVDGLCVHCSVPQEKPVNRQFVRLSLPSNGPWFEGYTENPLGVKPTGEILPRRVYMES